MAILHTSSVSDAEVAARTAAAHALLAAIEPGLASDPSLRRTLDPDDLMLSSFATAINTLIYATIEAAEQRGGTLGNNVVLSSKLFAKAMGHGTRSLFAQACAAQPTAEQALQLMALLATEFAMAATLENPPSPPQTH